MLFLFALLSGSAHAAVLHCGDAATLRNDVFPKHLQRVADRVQPDSPVSLETRDRRLLGATLHPTQAGLNSLVSDLGYSVDGGTFEAVRQGALPISLANGVLRIGEPPAGGDAPVGTCILLRADKAVRFSPGTNVLATKGRDDDAWTPVEGATAKRVHTEFDVLGMHGLAPAEDVALDEESLDEELGDLEEDLRRDAPKADAGPMRVHHHDLRLKALKKPLFPADADEDHVKCRVDVVISARGLPTDIKVDGCPEVFQEATVDAARKWRWHPHKVDGEKVAVRTLMMVKFQR